MDWTTVLGVGGPLAGLLVGGLFGRRKTKADAHSIVITDATTFGKMMLERAERAEGRIDALEDRENKRDELARQHLRWDWRQVRSLADLGITVEDPPPLFLYDDNPTTKGNRS
jgi:hypothetical protein